MTYRAGINAKKISHKPLVVHVHATEFDRTGGHPDQRVYNIERQGMHAADCIIAVSNFTKGLIVEHYGIPPEKVRVVHNAIDLEDRQDVFVRKNSWEKIVLFLGRITVQKGPDYFLYAAKRVLEQEPDVRFVFAGSGDMESFIIEKAAELGIADRVLFTGFLQGEDIVRAYKMADLFVMPSISEPFGLTPLEAMSHGTPVIISKQSGVSEVLKHALKADFWDIDRMADMMLSVLRHDVLKKELSGNGLAELQKFSWSEAAQKCVSVYNEVLGAQHG
jgi:glycosyltransferase involved in cell wall biosynthesis